MSEFVQRLWGEQNKHPGDREALFRAVDDVVAPEKVLYPGSYIDIAASFVFDDVTYVDIDKRANRFFGDEEGVRAIVSEANPGSMWRFIHADFEDPLDIPKGSVDLVVSLYAGLISDACARYLRIGGHLLANTSHGDVALAAQDDRYTLVGVVMKRETGYRVVTDDLDDYLTPKKGEPPTAPEIRTAGRGIAYRKPAAAHLFQRIT